MSFSDVEVLILSLCLFKSSTLYMYIRILLIFLMLFCFFHLKTQNWRGPARLRHGSYKFTCWFSGRFSEAFGGLSCVRLLSGEKTPLCKNICCGNGCQTPFCGLRLFFAQRLSFVLIIYVGERIMIKILENVAMQLSNLQWGCVYTFISFIYLLERNISL